MFFCKQGECDPSYGADFKYFLWANELIIGEIFIRVYNEQKHFPLEVALILICMQSHNVTNHHGFTFVANHSE